MRFRRWPFAITADIANASLQTGAHGANKNVHRFLLVNDDGTVRHMRFHRVPFGNTSSLSLLNTTIKHQLSKYSQNAVVKKLKYYLYVDNWLNGGGSIREVYEQFKVTGLRRLICHLRNW